MPFEDAIGQIIKVLLTALTMIPLPRFISIVFTSLGHLLRVTLGTTDTFRPAYFSDFGITFFILYQILDVEHLSALFIYSVRLAYGFTSPFANNLLAIHIEPLLIT